MKFDRIWAMPSKNTFSIPPIANLLSKYIKKEYIVVDPFSNGNSFATISNDLNPSSNSTYHLEAREFIKSLKEQNTKADIVLLDPPYSPRQITEMYSSIGLKASKTDTQNAKLYKECKDGLKNILKDNGIAICCGWNSNGFGKNRGFELIELLLVPHGSAHNDTIVTVERSQK